MRAVVEIGGGQYLVEEGARLKVPRLPYRPGETFRTSKLLLLRDEEETWVGRPWVEKGSVQFRVLGHLRGDKILGYKFRRRENYRRKLGHRPELTQLEVLKIEIG